MAKSYADIIRMVDEMRPNAVPQDEKCRILHEIEMRVHLLIGPAEGFDADDVPAEVGADSMTDVLMRVQPPFDALYLWYLAAQVDAYAVQTAAYENDIILFNRAWDDYAKFYVRSGRARRCVYGAG